MAPLTLALSHKGRGNYLPFSFYSRYKAAVAGFPTGEIFSDEVVSLKRERI